MYEAFKVANFPSKSICSHFSQLIQFFLYDSCFLPFRLFCCCFLFKLMHFAGKFWISCSFWAFSENFLHFLQIPYMKTENAACFSHLFRWLNFPLKKLNQQKVLQADYVIMQLGTICQDIFLILWTRDWNSGFIGQTANGSKRWELFLFYSLLFAFRIK